MTTSIAALLEDALREIAGPDAQPTSMTIDYGALGGAFGAATAGSSVTRAWVERSTRSLIFAQAEARTQDGSAVAIASAVFRRAVAS
ncbi:hypothetical protein [Caulobacter soli]|uniref:hypothetical protein n=1 Tax=Caulobacter soli TaxID=2708539 RepID=UPI0013ECEFE5|nr:hypothetical protein [Caulobacter soli]